MVELNNIDDAGCPSNLAPPEKSVSGANPDAFVRHKGGLSELDLAVYGAKCSGCIAKIEGGIKTLPGVETVRLNLSTGKLYIAWRGGLSPQEITEKISSLGYRSVPYDPSAAEKENDAYGRKLIRSLAVAGFATANIMLLSVAVWASTNGEMGQATRDFMHLVSAIIAIPAALYAGQVFFSSAWRALKAGGANMDVPISLAVLLALGFSLFEALHHGTEAYFDAAVMLLFFLLIGRWLDHKLRNKARTAARDLLALQAVTANRIEADGSIHSMVTKDIKVGDKLLLSPGDRVPVNGEIFEGISEMDTALVTGESAPILRQVGDTLEAGIVNLSKPLKMVAMATVDESLIAELARMVEAGQQVKSRYVRIADKAAQAYVPIVHTLSLLTFLGWFFVAEAGMRVSLMNAIAVLIITCPCALGLATPAVQIVATGRLFKDGILVKTGDALERLSHITKIIFDKTGTLTLGKLKLQNKADIPQDILQKAACLARTSHHPIARAIVEEMGGGPVSKETTEIPGAGMQGFVEGELVKIGHADFVAVDKADTANDKVSTWVKIGDQPPVALFFEDTLRQEAGATIEKFKQHHIKSLILSGDRPAPVQKIAQKVGISEFYAQLTPQEKIDLLEQARAAGDKIAMVGDGLNDTPVLALADVSLSPGSAADAAQSAADFVFQGNSLKPVWTAWQISRKAQSHIKQNFMFAALYNVIAAPMAMAGMVTPLIAALAMSGSSLIVTLNALRLSQRGKEEL
ncbi:MAG: heavy metal translocating P-type ATPase [bacterium]